MCLLKWAFCGQSLSFNWTTWSILQMKLFLLVLLLKFKFVFNILCYFSTTFNVFMCFNYVRCFYFFLCIDFKQSFLRTTCRGEFLHLLHILEHLYLWNIDLLSKIFLIRDFCYVIYNVSFCSFQKFKIFFLKFVDPMGIPLRVTWIGQIRDSTGSLSTC